MKWIIFNLSNEYPFFPLFFALVTSFLLTILGLPRAIRHFHRLRKVVRDMHKLKKRVIPDSGGIPCLMAALFSFVMTSYLFKVSALNYVVASVILIYALFGVLDDYIHIKSNLLKIIIPYFFALPLSYLVSNSQVELPLFSKIDFGIFYFLVIIPIYVLVVANLVNTHSGFNGLQSGLSSILFTFLFIKIFLDKKFDYMLFPFVLAGTIFAFWFFNKYPAKIIEGNIGSMVNGATIGTVIIIKGYLVSGFIMLIPHTINFLMYAYWRSVREIQRRRFGKASYYYEQHKFAQVREDRTLKPPNCLTFKWVLPYYFKMTEIQATRAMYLLTLVFCIIGLFIPY